jgi:hypothetical protein
MRTILKTMIAGLIATASLGTVFASNAAAQCGYSDGQKTVVSMERRSWQGDGRLRPASLLLISGHEREGDTDDGIVGFWKVKFVAKDSAPIPDDTVVDFGFARCHSDGTEILDSSRPPATSNFCLGVWQKTGRSHYKLNHFALSSDPSGKLIGPARIQEDAFLDHHGDSYSGTFTIDQYDLAGKPVAHVQGLISATRIGVDTPVEMCSEAI